MIKIEMSFESGAQAREEMLSLLGADLPCFSGDDDLPSVRTLQALVAIEEDAARRREAAAGAMDFGAVEDRAVAAALVSGEIREEPARRTRRTKAQIAADEAAAEARAKAEAAGLTETALCVAADSADTAAAKANESGEADAGEDPNTPPSAVYAHRAAEYLAANPGTTPLQHMKAELTKVNDKFGLDEVRKLMVDFGTPRIGEVPVEKYPALLAVIDKQLEA